MPELVVAAVADAIWTYAGVGLATAFTMSEVAIAAAAVFTLRDQQRRAESKARDSYNASLRDRYVMVRGATEQRQLVLGRQRVSGPIGFIRSYGSQNEHLVFTVLLAAHEVDAIESIYFDDEPVVLDGSGNVTATQRQDEFSIAAATGTFTISSVAKTGTVTAVAKYGTTTTTLTVTSVAGLSVSVSGASSTATGLLVITYAPDPCPYAPTVTASNTYTYTPASSGDAGTTPSTPDSGSVGYWQSFGAGDAQQQIWVPASVAGSTVTPTGATPGTPATIAYQTTTAYSRARVRKYTGAAGQAADAAMISNLGGVWTSAHVGAGLAYLVVELDYDQDSFPSGIPNVSAVVRGLKCLDPRSGSTVWTENPALLLRAYATHALGGRQASSAMDDVSISAAANVCDASTAYIVGTNTNTRALYTGGLTVKAGARPSDVLNDLAQAMGGRWCMVDGTLKVKAGTYSAPVMALDESWLHDGGAVTVTPGRNRQDVINEVTGTFADQDADYKVVQFPKVIASAYVSTDGAELPTDMQMAAVTWTGQAQYIAACALRYARAALTVKMTCNLRAYQCEPFDVISVSLARFGWVGTTMEVLDTSWTLDGGIELTLKAIDATVWQLDAGYTAGVPAANTRLPSPWGIPVVAGLSAVSDASTVQKQPDGSKKARILVSWTAVSDQRVTQNGSVELRWGLATDPEAKWQSVLCAGNATTAYLDPVHVGSSYIVKARTVTADAVSNWGPHVLCAVSNTAYFSGTVDFSTGVTGGTKPANNATVNHVTYSSSAPGSPVDGDFWVDTSTSPYVIKLRVSGAWQTGANLSTGALAQLNSVDTSQIVAGAVTEVTVNSGPAMSAAAIASTYGITPYAAQLEAPFTITLSVAADVIITASLDLTATYSGAQTLANITMAIMLDTGSTRYAEQEIHQSCVDNILTTAHLQCTVSLSAGTHLIGVFTDHRSGIRTPSYLSMALAAAASIRAEVIKR